ncbi:MAG: nitroreductase family protein [Spirochaetales bacterium]|nr:nitroreductase family protein [Spirochaetales bacterium]
MKLLPQIERRFSCTDFLDEPVGDQDITLILDAGRRAPSAKNRQAWRFIVINDSETKKGIQNAAFGQEHVGSASLIIALCTTNIDYRMPNGQLSYPIDISIASAFMLLQAESLGYATCYISTYDETKVREIVSVPYSMKVVMLLLVGKAGSRGLPKEKKSLHEVSSFNHW